MTTPSIAPVPLSQPYYNAPFGEAVRRFYKKYATFSGRASRAEYWWWALVAAIVNLVLQTIIQASGVGRLNADGTMGNPGPVGVLAAIILFVWVLATIVPTIALTVRRLHDTDRSGWWVFIALVPLVGGIVLLVFTLSAPVPAGERFDLKAA
ncbi:DUF805 domain-containing protein [Subtercola boreus]|uniref:DUF805 domain-containing protein n=1 Tax=Subtercola boreus TaxID=120213 RepID=A0A3E0VL44_9MICO|nr:DUF805 domain-containing protein [Subtercola boreus]RFA10682.1 DUF805 domain-containing protein [Subtercola boreus]TQL55758.1 uncharacterized membrane protein YhaH (DUF805 family) [Subtercola boreus]